MTLHNHIKDNMWSPLDVELYNLTFKSLSSTDFKLTFIRSDAFVEKCDVASGKCFITDMPSGKWADTERAGDGTNPKPKVSNNLEYLDQDLQNIPINTQLNIIINVFRYRKNVTKHLNF